MHARAKLPTFDRRRHSIMGKCAMCKRSTNFDSCFVNVVANFLVVVCVDCRCFNDYVGQRYPPTIWRYTSRLRPAMELSLHYSSCKRKQRWHVGSYKCMKLYVEHIFNLPKTKTILVGGAKPFCTRIHCGHVRWLSLRFVWHRMVEHSCRLVRVIENW